MNEALYISVAAVTIAFIGTLVVPMINHQLEIKRQYRREKMELYKKIVHYFNMSRVYFQRMVKNLPEDAPREANFAEVGFDDTNPLAGIFTRTFLEWEKEREQAELVTPDFIFLENDRIRECISNFRKKTKGDIRTKTVNETISDTNELGLLLNDIIPEMQKDLGLKPRPKRSKEDIMAWA